MQSTQTNFEQTGQQANPIEEQERGTNKQDGATKQENEPTQDEQEGRVRVLEIFVRRHHPETQIIGDRQAGMMTRSEARQGTCLVCEFEPKNVKVALENDEWVNEMKEEIEKIEKNNTQILVP